MSIETEIQALTTATTDLLDAVNVGKVNLDTAVSDALASETNAAASASDAAISATESQTSAQNSAISATASADSATAAASSASLAGVSASQAVISANSAASSSVTATLKADEAISAASAATAASIAIDVTANVSAWNAATNYNVGAVVYSTTNYQNYRRIVAGTTATDPYLDAVNWIAVGFNPLEVTLPVALSHKHTINREVFISSDCNAVSILPLNILSGGVVNVGKNTTWTFFTF